MLEAGADTVLFCLFIGTFCVVGDTAALLRIARHVLKLEGANSGPDSMLCTLV